MLDVASHLHGHALFKVTQNQQSQNFLKIYFNQIKL